MSYLCMPGYMRGRGGNYSSKLTRLLYKKNVHFYVVSILCKLDKTSFTYCIPMYATLYKRNRWIIQFNVNNTWWTIIVNLDIQYSTTVCWMFFHGVKPTIAFSLKSHDTLYQGSWGKILSQSFCFVFPWNVATELKDVTC